MLGFVCVRPIPNRIPSNNRIPCVLRILCVSADHVQLFSGRDTFGHGAFGASRVPCVCYALYVVTPCGGYALPTKKIIVANQPGHGASGASPGGGLPPSILRVLCVCSALCAFRLLFCALRLFLLKNISDFFEFFLKKNPKKMMFGCSEGPLTPPPDLKKLSLEFFFHFSINFSGGVAITTVGTVP